MLAFGIHEFANTINNVHMSFLSTDTWALRKFYRYKARYDEKEIRALTVFVRDKSVFWDIGANYGIYTLSMLKFFGKDNRVVLFEPLPQVFKILKKNLEANSAYEACNIYPINCALGTKTGTDYLYLSSLGTADSRLYEPTDNLLLNQGQNRQKIQVSVDQLDNTALTLFGNYPTDNIVKIDVQGKELDVLKGAESLISKSERTVVFLEFWPHGLKQNGVDPKQLLSFFQQRGFSIKGNTDKTITSYDELEGYIASHEEGLKSTNLFFLQNVGRNL